MKKVKYRSGKKVVVYARFSCSKQQEQSIEGQLLVCNEWAEREGYEIVTEYIDRANYTRMIDDLTEGDVYADAILGYAYNRLNRNIVDSELIRQEMDKYGIRIYSATEVYDDSAAGHFVRSIIAAKDAHYDWELSEKTSRGMYQSMLNGTSTGSLPPFGYKWVEKRLVIDETKRDCVPIIFEMYAEGKSKASIAKELNSRGYTSRKGQPFKISDFENMLKNKKYIGQWEFDGKIINEHGNEPLISVEVFDKVQEMLKYKRKYGGGEAKQHRTYALSGHIYCGGCGCKMLAAGGKGRLITYYYYRCPECHKTARQDILDEYCYKQTIDTFKLSEGKNVELLADNLIKAYNEENRDIVADSRTNELKAITKKIDSLVLAIAENPAIALILAPKLSELDSQRQTIEVALQAEDKAKKKVLNKRADMITWLSRFFDGKEGGVPTEDILKRFVSTVVVFSSDEKQDVAITWSTTSTARQLDVKTIISEYHKQRGDSSNNGLTKPQNENITNTECDGDTSLSTNPKNPPSPPSKPDAQRKKRSNPRKTV